MEMQYLELHSMSLHYSYEGEYFESIYRILVITSSYRRYVSQHSNEKCKLIRVCAASQNDSTVDVKWQLQGLKTHSK